MPIIAFVIMLVLAKWFLPLLKAKFFTDDYSHLKEHPLLMGMLIVSSMFVAFSIGANNVANAAAPIASLTANEIGQSSISNLLPIIILSVLIVAPCFAIGSSLFKGIPTSLVQLNGAAFRVTTVCVPDIPAASFDLFDPPRNFRSLRLTFRIRGIINYL